MLAKNASTLAHCYYLAKLTLDIVSTACIQFKAMEVLLTIYEREPGTFSVVQLDLCQHLESLTGLDQANKERFHSAIEYINQKFSLINHAFRKSTSKQKSKMLEQSPEELLDSNSDDLSILHMVADHLTCPFTQRVTDDFRLLPCGHRISYLALREFMKYNYQELRCFYCQRDIDIADVEQLSSSPVYERLYKKLSDAGYSMPAKVLNSHILRLESDDDPEEISMRRSKFYYLVQSASKKSLSKRIQIPMIFLPACWRGKIAYKQRKYNEAALLFEKAQQHYPESFSVIYHLGIAYFKMGGLLNSQKALTQAIQKYPSNAKAWTYLGWCYIDRKQYRNARNALNQALDIRPSYARALIYYGMMHGQIKQFDKALEIINRALTIKKYN